MIAKQNDIYKLVKVYASKVKAIEVYFDICPKQTLRVLLQMNGYSGFENLKAYYYYRQTAFDVVAIENIISEYNDIDFDKFFFYIDCYRNEEIVFNIQEEIEFKNKYPITSDMSPSDKARRNQKLGQISRRKAVGELFQYKYYWNSLASRKVKLEQCMDKIWEQIEDVIEMLTVEDKIELFENSFRLVEAGKNKVKNISI